MKAIFLIPFWALATTNLVIAETLTLTITHKNIEQTGSIVCSVFNNNETFLREPLTNIRVQASSSGATELQLQLEPLTQYALSCYLDTNDNGKLDTNFFGIPSEPVAASNNASAILGPPSYQDARFTISADAENHQSITLDFVL